MKIKKQTSCEIVLHDGDFISDVIVRNNHDYREDQVGCLIHDNGNPYFVCTKLIVEGGKVANLQIKLGGEVDAFEGELLNVELMQGGRLNTIHATVHNLKEVGGAFFINNVEDPPEYSCTFKGFVSYIDTLCTIHRGTQINNSNFCGKARCSIFDGGILSTSNISKDAGVIVLGGRVYGIISTGFVEVHDGYVENTQIIGGKLTLWGGHPQKFVNTSVSNKAQIHRKAYCGSTLPPLDGLIIENGTKIINEIDEGDNGIYRETIIWSNKTNKKKG